MEETNNNSSLSLFSSNNRNNILEPLTTLVRLCMIYYENPGIKIGVNYNKIIFYRNNGFQSVFRRIYSESRENLHNLHNPIKKAAEWYSCQCIEIKYIFQYAILGLNKLRESYEYQSIISHSLDSYSQILQNEINVVDNSNSVIYTNHYQKILPTDVSESEKGSLYKSLMNIWDYRNIQTIYNILKDLEECNLESLKWSHLKTVENIISIKDQQVYDIIINNSTIL